MYASRANVERRITSLQRLGYSVESAAYTTTEKEYVTIRARLGGSGEALVDAWASRFSGKSIRHADCI